MTSATPSSRRAIRVTNTPANKGDSSPENEGSARPVVECLSCGSLRGAWVLRCFCRAERRLLAAGGDTHEIPGNPH